MFLLNKMMGFIKINKNFVNSRKRFIFVKMSHLKLVSSIYVLLLIFFNCTCTKITTTLPQKVNNTNPNEPTLLWHTDLSNLNGGDFFSANPVIYQNLVIFSTFNNNVLGEAKIFALNKETGELVWKWENSKSKTGIIPKNMYIINNILLVAITNIFQEHTSQIVAIDITSGKTIWHNLYEHNRFVYDVFVTGLNNNFFHFRTGGGDEKKYELYKTDANTGISTLIKTFENDGTRLAISLLSILKYTDELNKQYLIFGITKYESNTSYDSIKDYVLCNYSITNDSFLYIKNINEFSKFQSNQIVTAVNENGIFYSGKDVKCFDIKTGLYKWSLYKSNANVFEGSIDVYKDLVIYPTACYDFNSKKKLWDINRNANNSTHNIFYNYKMYFTSLNDSRFHCYDLKNGQELFAMYAPARVAGSNKLGDNFTDGALTIDSVNNRFYAATYKEALCFKFNP